MSQKDKGLYKSLRDFKIKQGYSEQAATKKANVQYQSKLNKGY